VRIISCSENEIEDEAIPPHLSGCGAEDTECHARYRERFAAMVAPIHADFNAFLAEHGEAPYPLGQFFEASPFLNLLLYPEAVKFRRAHPLPPERFQYLEGCVREEAPYELPAFPVHGDAPLVYVSFGSLGAGDTEELKRIIAVLGGLACRALVNVGDHQARYEDVPPNVHLASWYPQPSVIAMADLVIHHGGNNSFTECLYFGKPAIIIPYVWDGHDNATRVAETGHGLKLPRARWSEAELAAAFRRCLEDEAMRARLRQTSAAMRAGHGPSKAAALLDGLLRA
jgi:UDP:flavonoid glycosyltransferase YjiC (YdhE family)